METIKTRKTNNKIMTRYCHLKFNNNVHAYFYKHFPKYDVDMSNVGKVKNL